MKFNVNDKVRCFTPYIEVTGVYSNSLVVGEVYTVSKVWHDSAGFEWVQLTERGLCRAYHTNRFELVIGDMYPIRLGVRPVIEYKTSKIGLMSLDELIEVANAGELAQRHIREQYRDQVELRRVAFGKVSSWYNTLSTTTYEFRKRVKPKLEPFKLRDTGHQIELYENGTLRIGCEHAPLQDAIAVIKGLMEDNISSASSNQFSLFASARGPYNHRGYMTWADAHQLHNALKPLDAFKSAR